MNTEQRVTRRPGDVFRDGFAHGFRDALRLAAREIDCPHAWLVLDRLAEQYELVS